jgi:peptide/nickel transport system substrate-binding protein
MRRKTRSEAVLRVVVVALAIAMACCVLASAESAVPNPNTLMYVKEAGWDTFDPAWAYDRESGEALLHIYGNLITRRFETSMEFMPQLALEVPTLENGLMTLSPDGSGTVRFHIRDGVRFHNGDLLTPEDVVYSFRRMMLSDPSGGPMWIVLFPLLHVYELNEIIDSEGADAAYQKVIESVYVPEDDASAVEFKVALMVPYLMHCLTDNWASIQNKSWCIEQGAWDGTPDNWLAWHDLAKEEMALFDKACGTGPWILDGTPDPTTGYTLIRNDDYYDQENLPILSRVEVIYISEWTTRRLMLVNGDADIATIPFQFSKQFEGTPGLRTIYPLPQGAVWTVLMNQDITAEGNERIGSGQLDGNGIPTDFFTDIHVRRGMSYAFPYDAWLDQVYGSEAKRAISCVPTTVEFHDPNQSFYAYDPTAAAEEFKQAWGGAVWENGFWLSSTYETGDEAAKTAMDMLRESLAEINPKFQVEVRTLPWSNYLAEEIAYRQVLWGAGWFWDYPDPDNFAQPFLHTTGANGDPCNLRAMGAVAEQMDSLIFAAASTFDQDARRDYYYQIQHLAYEYAMNLTMREETERRWMRSWVGGMQYNPIWSGWNFSELYKEIGASVDEAQLAQFDCIIEEW